MSIERVRVWGFTVRAVGHGKTADMGATDAEAECLDDAEPAKPGESA